MRFNFTPEEQAFRQEVKDFLAAEWTENHDLVPGSAEAHAEEMGMRKKLADKGWLALSWPEEYGGSDASVMQQVIFTDEWSYAHAPGRDGEGIGYIGPAIMVHGTEEQKKEHIGGIARGEVVWARVTRSPSRVPTSLPSRPAPSSKVTSGSSTDRRSGPLRPTSPTGFSCSPAQTPMPPSTGALPCSSPT